MGKIYRKQLVEGVDLPGIIHNGSYFYTRLDVFEDGVIGCWKKRDLNEFRDDLKTGWVTPFLPTNKNLNIHGLGCFLISDAKWLYNEKTFYQHILKVVEELNPEMKNIYHTTKRIAKKWETHRVAWSASGTPCKLKEGFGYQLLNGKNTYLFYRKENHYNEEVYLATLTAFKDKTLKLDVTGDEVYSPKQVEELFSQGRLCSTLKEGKEWVTIEGLGELLMIQREENRIDPLEKQKEISNLIKRICNEKDAHDICIDAYYQYLIYPCEETREVLRKAYEAVPEHERMYLGDMDNRDSDFRRILYEPNRKREV